jgi:formate dehydrogenase subunit gamma
MKSVNRIRAAFAALAFGAALALTPAPVSAQAPVNPTASAVKEEQLLKELDRVTGRVSIPDRKAGVVIQPEGREFRARQTRAMPWIAIVAIFGMIAAIAAFYLYRGRIMIDSGKSGMTIRRFGGFDRFVHWTTAVSFLTLAATGLNTAFGRALLLPLMGEHAFAEWAEFAKTIHNYVAFAFMAGILMMFVLWVKDNIFAMVDMEWIRSFGGLFSHNHPPSGRFNFGEKWMFWSIIFLGAAISATGLMLLFPFQWAGIQGMQWAMFAHGVVGVVFFAAILAHIYIGSLGMEGAFEAMGSGRVDVNWAKEHHSVWAEEELRKQTPQPADGRIAAPAE